MMSNGRSLLAALVVALSLATFAPAGLAQRVDAGSAPDVPLVAAPAATYRDPDPAAVARHSPDPYDARIRAMAARRLAATPDDATAIAQAGYWAAQRGDADRAARLFAIALEAAGDDRDRRRAVQWSHGWALFGLGDDAAAIRAWQAALDAHGGAPFWYPYTIALPLWRLGQHDLAVAYYDAAARSVEAYATREGLVDRTRGWKPPERAAIDAVFAAWQARRHD